MNKRLILSIATAALLALPVSAGAAIPANPTQQEMEHGVQPTVSGYGDYSDAPAPPSTEPAEPAEPAPAESIPTPAEQGVSTSPGGVEPAIEPGSRDEAQQAAEEDSSEDQSSCDGILASKAELREQLFLVGSWMFYLEGTAAGDALEGVFEELSQDFEGAKLAEELECDEGEGETAE